MQFSANSSRSIFALGAFLCALPLGTATANEFSMDLIWSNQKNMLLDFNAPSSAQPILDNRALVRTWIQLPPDMIIDSVDGDNISYYPGDPGLSRSLLTLDLLARKTHIKINTHRSDGTPDYYNLKISYTQQPPLLLVHPWCHSLGLEVQVNEVRGSNHSLVGVNCSHTSNEVVTVDISYPEDASLWLPDLRMWYAKPGPMRFIVRMNDLLPERPKLVARFELAGDRNENTDRYQLVWTGHADNDVPIMGPQTTTTVNESLPMLAQELDLKIQAAPPTKIFKLKSNFILSAGYTLFNYTETGVANYSQNALTAKFAMTVPLFGSNWDFGANAFITALPFQSSRSDVTVRSLGGNLRIGYALPFIQSPWRFTLMAGVSFSALLVSNQSFGYSPYMNPQFYPVLRRSFGSHALSFYLKYVPLGENLANLSLTEREFAAGGSWSFPAFSGTSMALTFDFSDSRFNISPAVATTSQVMAVGLGLGF